MFPRLILGTNQYTFNATEPLTDDQYLVRIDQTFNSKDTLWGTWFQESFPVNDTVPFAGATLPGFGSTGQATLEVSDGFVDPRLQRSYAERTAARL